MNQAQKDVLAGLDIPPITPDEYARILKGLSLQRIALVSCQISSDAHSVERAFQQHEPLPIDMKEDVSYEERDDLVFITHAYRLSVKSKRKTVFSLQAQYALVFGTEAGFTPEFFEVFRHIAVPMYTWPYLRELADSMTGRMDLPKLTLPLLQQEG